MGTRAHAYLLPYTHAGTELKRIINKTLKNSEILILGRWRRRPTLLLIVVINTMTKSDLGKGGFVSQS